MTGRLLSDIQNNPAETVVVYIHLKRLKFSVIEIGPVAGPRVSS